MSQMRDRRAFLRGLLTTAAGLSLAACDKLGRSESVRSVLDAGEYLSERTQRALAGESLAPEFPATMISAHFKPNGSTDPGDEAYRAHAANAFADWRLEVGGLVERPLSLSLNDIRELPQRTQITRHDCVEGWSVIGQWRGARLSALLDRAGLKPSARFIAFFCADTLERTLDGTGDYYETIGIADAYHEQTILAYELNDRVLPVSNGAPLRLRVERQLGYKMAKYVMRIEALDDFAHLGRGKGGFWEDRGYQWYAGI
jgi:DMSO/TMAO reductase YedYZ molybdopterin-dependent catalytic subunit